MPKFLIIVVAGIFPYCCATISIVILLVLMKKIHNYEFKRMYKKLMCYFLVESIDMLFISLLELRPFLNQIS